MMRFLLNSAVITAPGTYSYVLLSPTLARQWYEEGSLPRSTIGYWLTCEYLSEVLGHPVPQARISIEMQPDDQALVCRLKFSGEAPRLPSEAKAQRFAVQQLLDSGEAHWELGLLGRVS